MPAKTRKFEVGQEVTVIESAREKYSEYGEKMQVDFYKNTTGFIQGNRIAKPKETGMVRCSWLDKNGELVEKSFHENDLVLAKQK